MCETGKYGFCFFLNAKKKNSLRMDSKYTVTSSTALSSGSKYIELREHDVILKKLTSLSADFCKKRIFNVLFLFKNIIFQILLVLFYSSLFTKVGNKMSGLININLY